MKPPVLYAAVSIGYKPLMDLRSHQDWGNAIVLMRDYVLRDAAKQRTTVNYTQLAAWINSKVGFTIEARSTAMDILLEDLAREEFDESRPMLTALVVQQNSNGIPGSGFFRIASELNRLPVRSRNDWLRIRDEVWDYYQPAPASFGGDFHMEHETTDVPRATRINEPPEYSVAAYSVAARQLEDELISRYETYLGRTLPVLRIRVTETICIVADAIDRQSGRLIEAKSSSGRAHVRMAIGQLFDYERHLSFRPTLAVLLPERPEENLIELLKNHKIVTIYEESPEHFNEE
jgi:hypothetical protein